MKIEIKSWGQNKKSQSFIKATPFNNDFKNLVVGSCLSYGDSCLNSDENIIFNTTNNCLLSFDPVNSVLHAQAGITFDDILKFLVPRGYFVPVTPGTKFITLGGAVANDIHGKNHHNAGTFGAHVLEMQLERSDGVYICNHSTNSDLFNATIGGLGLTGFIKSVKFKVIKISSSFIRQTVEKFHGIDEYLELNAKYSSADYTVAWLDCFYKKGSLVSRGLFISGDFFNDNRFETHCDPKFSIPLSFPNFCLNSFTVKMFNTAYFHKQLKKIHQTLVHYDPFFYPLDSIQYWNKIYGKNGLFQFQCVLPKNKAKEGMHKLLNEIAKSGEGSFLSVLKSFGDIQSPGILSFPHEGLTLCLDFSNHSHKTVKLFSKLHAIVSEYDGKLYPAKDSFMDSKQFNHSYGAFESFTKFIDPRFSSDFLKRIKG